MSSLKEVSGSTLRPSRWRRAIRRSCRRRLTIQFLVLATAIIVTGSPSRTEADNLVPASVQKLIDAYKIPASAISLIAQEIGADRPLVRLNENLARNPASTIKLVTTFTALEVLGPTYTWPTEIYALGPIKHGVLEGDLLIKGHGDPNLVTDEFWKMLGELYSRGVKKITGDLVVDDSFFDVPASDPGAFDARPDRLYNVIPNATMVNFKAVEFQFYPARDGKHVDIRVHPEMSNLRVTNNLSISKRKCDGYERGIDMRIFDPATNDHVVFAGAFPSGCRSHSMRRSVLNHDTYAYGTFKRLWKHWGGSIDGTVRKGVAPKQRAFVTKQSQPLAEIIRGVNKWSNNVMTRQLLYSLATAKFKPPYTKEQGIEVVRDYFHENKIDDSSLIIDNGAGLSRDARVSVGFMNQLLRHAYRSPYMPEFVSSLSLLGLDGTTSRRFKDRPEVGRMHLKTGSIDGVSAITGYVNARSGKIYTVALIVNYKTAHQGPGKAIQDAFLDWIYDQ
ncbi:MAG: D-alanyl-D-alanine carboxypeptidase/D-alanyl-D-alanine-endopeptidase (penicillin-binding protein 4) [Gammaproteobacteria bacterium]|jgi:D-alanyl-D-alanine carboxypeptidase/D-alanyl-D-alanine-endopeptidase (penicillin-binding protein 4)